jgi:NAD(P)-dependent dehydrogenase (short-subunit alcohol dehydrogenase family)
MQSILIIGASRGLGLEFVRQYRHDSWLTLGTSRSSENDALITATGASVIRLDVSDADSFLSLAKALDGRSIDVCIYNAGVFGASENVSVTPSKEVFDEVMHANVYGAMCAIPIVAPALAKSRGKFAFVTSRMGSISGTTGANAPLYRASKAALNMVVKTAANEYAPHGITSFVMHPGWVKTDMGGGNADIEPAVSIAGMRKVIANATAESNGHFFNYDGSAIQW